MYGVCLQTKPLKKFHSFSPNTHECVWGQMQKSTVGVLTYPHPKTALLLNILSETYQAVEEITLENALGYILVTITHALLD